MIIGAYLESPTNMLYAEYVLNLSYNLRASPQFSFYSYKILPISDILIYEYVTSFSSLTK